MQLKPEAIPLRPIHCTFAINRECSLQLLECGAFARLIDISHSFDCGNSCDFGLEVGGGVFHICVYLGFTDEKKPRPEPAARPPIF
jgi:hypothetical protein